MIEDAIRFFDQHDDILLIAHISPDGDTLGSSLALFRALRKMGKCVQVVCTDPVPESYRFCVGAEEFLLPREAHQADAVVTVDCADVLRTGDCKPLFDGARDTLNIDHHGTNRGYAKNNYVRRAGATGELIYHLLVALKCEVDPEIASLLYVAIASDTGNFAYSGTSPDTFRIAAALLECGIDLPALNRLLFRTVPYRKLLLRARMTASCNLYANECIAISTVTRRDLIACGATEEDCEGLIDDLRDIETVEIAAILRESSDGTVRVSLRGKQNADVSKIALQFGGGGHRLAAGCTMHIPIAEAEAAVLEAALMMVSEGA